MKSADKKKTKRKAVNSRVLFHGAPTKNQTQVGAILRQKVVLF